MVLQPTQGEGKATGQMEIIVLYVYDRNCSLNFKNSVFENYDRLLTENK